MAVGKEVFSLQEDWLGGGEAIISWQKSDNLLAVCGSNRLVNILDRQGKKYAELPLPENSHVIALDWDKDGESLAILQEGLSFAIVWNINTRSYTQIEVGNRDKTSFVKWSYGEPVLAIGSEKGAITYFNKATQKKIPTVGKHSRNVMTGDWSHTGFLVTGSSDRTLTVSNKSGDTLTATQLRSEPRLVKWSSRVDGYEGIMAMILDNVTLMVYDSSNKIEPCECRLRDYYGRIVTYEWFNSDQLLVGMSEGYLVALSTNPNDLGSELFATRLFNTSLHNLCICESLGKIAVAGDDCIKILSLPNFKEVRSEKIDMPLERGRVVDMHWTHDGQLLTVTTSQGHVYSYLMVVPSVSSTNGTTVSILTSLTQITVVECAGGVRALTQIGLDVEPSILSLGPYHIAAGFNTTIWYYAWKDHNQEIIQNGPCVNKRDYRGTVKQIAINHAWAAVLSEGYVSLHPIVSNETKSEMRFPESGDVKITAIAMTSSFLIMLDSSSRIRYFYMDEPAYVSEFKFDNPISAVYPNSTGTRVVVIDITGAGLLYSPVNDVCLHIPNFSSNVSRVIWDQTDHNMFVTVKQEQVSGYIYSPVSLYGPQVEPIRELLSIEDLAKELRESVTVVEKGQKPLLVCNGILFCHSEAQATIRGNFLSSHSYLTQWRGRSDTQEGHYRYFLQNLALKRFHQCYLVAEKLGGVKIPEVLGHLALQALDLEAAEKAYQIAKNVGMVYAIHSIKHESEKQILLGHVSMILQQHDLAQDFFLKSSKPSLALEMRCDLQDWLIALKLSRTVDSSQEPVLCKKLAQQLETQGNYSEALRLFEHAANTLQQAGLSQEELTANLVQSYAGMARTCIRNGDITRGYQIACELNDPQLKVECGTVCEQMKHFVEAADLYKRGGLPEKAASLYIRLKKWKDASELMNVITTPKLLIQLGKAKEAEGSYKDAEEAFEKAKDYENVIRLNLNNLENPEKAKDLIRNKCPTQAAALLMADYLERKGQRAEAIEFLVLADKKEDAFVMAQSFDLMERYADCIIKREDKSQEEHIRIAQYFEGKNKMGQAARHYERAGNMNRALQLYMQSEDFYMDAIKMASRVKSDLVSMQLYDFFMGEIDGIPKDPKFIYELNLVMGRLKEAANIAVIIASEEQEVGNYKAAHDRLFATIRDMRTNKIAVPQVMQNKLMILHSYTLVKRFVKMQDHMAAARMLIRVAKNISQFPAHTVQILTSAVIECTRAGLKTSAYQWACILVRPEFRSSLDEKYKKQIEKVAIRRPTSEDPLEETSPCPFCNSFIYDTDLECENCKNTIPYCIASGRHMLLSEWTQCVSCKFPANVSQFAKMLEADPTCPMCESKVNSSSLRLLNDPVTELKMLTAAAKEDSD